MTEEKKKVAAEKAPPAAEPLAVCTLSNTPEHVRADDMGEPCDDGRAG